jgi:TolB-like protein/Tfp pilus assembly protein PilF
MVQSSGPSIQIDLNEFKLHLHLKSRTQLTLHFNSPSRRFYLSVIALVVHEMKKLGKIKSIPPQEHLDLLALLNESIGGAAGSSDKVNLLHRIYTKWKDALPNLEEAPLFKVLGRKKEEGDGAIGKIYSFTDAEKDEWANLFEYMGSDENVRLKFAIDKIGVSLDGISIIFGEARNGEAWDEFISSLKDVKQEEKEEFEAVEETEVPEPPVVPEAPVVPISPPQELKVSWFSRYRWVMVVVVIGIVAGAIGKIYLSPAPVEVASKEKMAFPLPDKPSIAVLPFANMSGDPKQEFLCDGMTEEIITALSKVPNLFVISRQSTFFYKGKPVKFNQVSEELGVRYVLEGSLQRSGDRVRIAAQLIDALTGYHLWAGRYDRDLQDIFALQDEMTLKILTAVRVKLTYGGDISRAEKFAEKYYRGKQGLDCYLKLTEAARYQRTNIEENNVARRMIEEAIAMCPENPMGYLELGWVYYSDYWMGNTKSPRETLEKGIELGQKVVAMDDSIADAHALLCALYLLKREYEKAGAEGERAMALNPGSPAVLHINGNLRIWTRRPEEAIPLFRKAIRLNPFGPSYLYRDFGMALEECCRLAPQSILNTGRFEEAVSALKKAIQIAPDDIYAHILLAVTYFVMGREKEARAEAAEVLRINPKFSAEKHVKTLPYSGITQSEIDEAINNFRKAGLK